MEMEESEEEDFYQKEEEGDEDDVEYQDDDGEFIINEDEMDFDDEDEEGNQGEEEEEADERIIPEDSIRIFDEHHSQPVYAVCWANHSDLVLSGGGDDNALLWNAQDPKQEPTVLGTHSDSIVAVSFSANDEWCAVGSMDGLVKAYNLTALHRQHSEVLLEGPGGEIEWLAWHPQHAVLLAGSSDTTVWMWNLAANYSNPGQVFMGILTGHQDSVSCGMFLPNGRRVLTSSLDGSLRVWDAQSLQTVFTIGPDAHKYHDGGIVSMCIQQQPQGGILVATGGGSEGSVCLVRLDHKKIVVKLMHISEDNTEGEVSIECLAFSQGRLNFLVSGGSDGRVVVWDLAVQAKRSVLTHGEECSVIRIIFLQPACDELITGSTDGLIRKWELRSGKLKTSWSGHRDAILDMQLKDNSLLVTGSDDGTCRLFSI